MIPPESCLVVCSSSSFSCKESGQGQMRLLACGMPHDHQLATCRSNHASPIISTIALLVIGMEEMNHEYLLLLPSVKRIRYAQ